MNLYLNNLYQALNDAVRASPDKAESKCLQLQTFKVLTHDGAIEMVQDAFGATACDKDTPHFYSRAWEKAGFPSKIVAQLPILTAFETQAQVIEGFTPPDKMLYTVAVTAWDKYDQAKTQRCEGCAARSVAKILEDTETLLMSVLRYLREMVQVTFVAGGEQGFYNQSQLNYLVSSGLLAKTDFSISGNWSNMLSARNKTIPIYRQQRVSDLYYGTTAIINFEARSCPAIPFDFSNQTFTKPPALKLVPCPAC